MNTEPPLDSPRRRRDAAVLEWDALYALTLAQNGWTSADIAVHLGLCDRTIRRNLTLARDLVADPDWHPHR